MTEKEAIRPAPLTCHAAELTGPSTAPLFSERPVSGRLHRAVRGSDYFQLLWALQGEPPPPPSHLPQTEKNTSID